MPDDKKNIPTLDQIIQPGKFDQATEAKPSADKDTADESDRRSVDRRVSDRRVSKEELKEGQIERRIEERRARQRREEDQQRGAALDELVNNIMQDMMPDLETHIRQQLRFELEKFMPRTPSFRKDEE